MAGHDLTPPLSQAGSKTGEDSSPVEVLGIDHREGRQALWGAVGEVHGPHPTHRVLVKARESEGQYFFRSDSGAHSQGDKTHIIWYQIR